jgi:uncharacterized protein YegJ (DUF2314 family)
MMSDELRLFDGDDPEMIQAFRNAQSTFKYFWREQTWEHRRIVPGLIVSSVKVCCFDPPELAEQHQGGAEHMWLSDVMFNGINVSGTLLNQPSWLVSYKEGQRISLPLNSLSDWMYVYTTGEVYGAFTVQLLRSKMGNRERKQHDEAWGLDFGDPNRVKIIPDQWNPGAPKKRGFFARLLGSETPPAKVDYQSVEHPMSENMAETLSDFLKNNPEAMEEIDELGWTMLHQLASAGSSAGVKALLAYGANKSAQDKNGLTPLQVTKALGWRNVAKLLEG